MSKSKKKAYTKESPEMQETLLPTPDKSADPPQPQGKTTVGDFPSGNKHNKM